MNLKKIASSFWVTNINRIMLEVNTLNIVMLLVVISAMVTIWMHLVFLFSIPLLSDWSARASFSYHFCNCLQSFYINKSEQVFRVSWWVRGDIVDSSNYSFHQKWMNKLCLCLSMPHAQQLSTKMHARQKIMKGENIYVWNLCWLPSEDGCCCELHTAGQAGLQDLIQLHTQSPCPIRVGVGCCRCELHP